MGFLIGLKDRILHGSGSTQGPQTVNPSSAVSTSIAKDASNALSGAPQSVVAPAATSNSVARTPAVALVAGAQVVTAPVAVSSSTVQTPNANRSIIAPAAISTSTARTPSIIGGGTSFMDTNAVPIEKNDPTLLVSDAALRSSISTNLNSNDTIFVPAKQATGGGGSFWNDGFNPDLVDLDPVAGPFGDQVYKCTYKGLNQGRSTPNPQLIHMTPSTTPWSSRIWNARYIKHDTAWTNYGDADSAAAVTFNGNEAAGMKTGPWAFPAFASSGRCGILDVGTDKDAEGGAGYDRLYGLISTKYANSGSEYNDGVWYLEVVLKEFYYTAGGTPYYIFTHWRKVATASNSTFVRVGPRLAQSMAGVPVPTGAQPTGSPNGRQKFNGYQPFSKNYNQARKTDITRWIGKNGWWDADNRNNDGSNDPWGCLAADADHTPLLPASNTLINVVGTTATFKVGLGRTYPFFDPTYSRYLRPVIDGVDQTTSDVLIPYEQTEGRIDVDQNANLFQFNLTVPTGTHNIAFKSLNLNKSHISSATSTVSVTGS